MSPSYTPITHVILFHRTYGYTSMLDNGFFHLVGDYFWVKDVEPIRH